MDKKSLRKECRKIRAGLPEKLALDKTLTDLVLDSEEYKVCENILLFSSIGSEYDTQDLFLRALADGKKVFYPRCSDNSIMTFHRVSSSKDMSVGNMHIPEPSATSPEYLQKDPHDLMIVPALCADRKFQRLGYGGGYYDCYLKSFSGVSICPVYSSLLFETIPTDGHDAPVDIIITEKERLEKE
ncbi:MAG: 5-formyltetrahydrofolate cyclo-ligase [Clostridiales bacterium]|nr:5-formyltetrahydrofolate cyclo-ligase [Clostridiales bacterium]